MSLIRRAKVRSKKRHSVYRERRITYGDIEIMVRMVGNRSPFAPMYRRLGLPTQPTGRHVEWRELKYTAPE